MFARHIFYIFSLFFPCLLFSKEKISLEKHLVVVIPTYNNKLWYQLNIASVLMQKYSNYDVYVIDDSSNDGSSSLIRVFLKNVLAFSKRKNNFHYILNRKRLGSLHNIYDAVHVHCRDDDIVLFLDGDDWLKHDQVFQVINQAYNDPEVWLTYGQFEYFTGGKIGQCAPIPDDVIQNNSYREFAWVTTHLRTCYASLFKRIKKSDLLINDEFFKVSGDQAFMLPLIEMAGNHARFISEILYVYNLVNPLNDIRVNTLEQEEMAKIIRKRVPYAALDSRYDT